MLLGEHAVVYGRHCIVTAVDAPVEVTVRLSKEFFFEAPDMNFRGAVPIGETPAAGYPREIAFAAQAVQNFFSRFGVRKPVHVATRSLLSTERKAGLGSSASVTAATLKALCGHFGTQASDAELFELCHQTVLDVQKIGSGFDVAAAVYGGTLLYKLKKPEPLHCKPFPLIIGYTGVPADTRTIVRQVSERIAQTPWYYEELFNSIEKLVLLAREALEQHELKKLGSLMNRNQELLRQMQAPSGTLGVSSEALETLIAAALDAGAHGAKLSGAGVGDCMIAVAPDSRKEEVEQALEAAGGTVIRAAAHVPGAALVKEHPVNCP